MSHAIADHGRNLVHDIDCYHLASVGIFCFDKLPFQTIHVIFETLNCFTKYLEIECKHEYYQVKDTCLAPGPRSDIRFSKRHSKERKKS